MHVRTWESNLGNLSQPARLEHSTVGLDRTIGIDHIVMVVHKRPFVVEGANPEVMPTIGLQECPVGRDEPLELDGEQWFRTLIPAGFVAESSSSPVPAWDHSESANASHAAESSSSLAPASAPNGYATDLSRPR